MRIVSCKWIVLLSAVLLPLGCSDTGTTGTSRTTERTTTTTKTTRQTAPPPTAAPKGDIDIDAGPNGRIADRRTANGSDRVDVDVTPGGGVDVDVKGEPIRDRIRERRAARESGLPR